MRFLPTDGDFARRVRASFGKQRFMEYLGARLTRVDPGFCEIEVSARDELTQHHGYVHAGVVGTIADNAAGFAAMTLMDPGASVLTVEYKLNLLSPAAGEKMVARGYVVRPGRTITVCRTEVVAVAGGEEKLCATSLTTMIAVFDRPEVER